MTITEEKAFETLQLIEEDIEEVVKIIDKDDIPLVEFIFKIINENFHKIFLCWTNIFCPRTDCFSDCVKDD